MTSIYLSSEKDANSTSTCLLGDSEARLQLAGIELRISEAESNSVPLR